MAEHGAPHQSQNGHTSRRLVVLLDGTGNEIGRNLSNVLKFYRMLRKSERQRVYYDPGVGTIAQPGAWTRFKQKALGVAGLALGVGLDENVLDAYAYLCREYHDGDEIFLLGFSRGAHTARVLAGLIHLLGLLKPDQLNLCGYALTAYKRASEEHDLGIAWYFRRIAGGRAVRIRFVGVWDTVASVIVPRRDRLYLIPDLETLPYTQSNPSVAVFRHAIAIDERRRMFRVSRWKEPQDFVINAFADPPESTRQDIRQVWFAGVHSDVGGGYPEEESQLSKFPLLWMVDEAEKAGLEFNAAMVNHLALGKQREGSSHEYEPPDAKGEMHRSLRRLWLALEAIPKRAKRKDWPGRPSLLGMYMPLAEPRFIPNGAVIHQSVLDRRAAGIGYAPINFPARHETEPHSLRMMLLKQAVAGPGAVGGS